MRSTPAALALTALLLAGCSDSSDGDSADTPAAADGTATCEWIPTDGSNPDERDVGTPPAQVPATGIGTLTLTLGQGDLGITLDRSGTPCAAASFTYLAEQGFFDGSPCHREVNQPSFGVLQCGDPSGTGRGGPTYRYAQEVRDTTTYPRGTVAMANTGQPDSTGSQFFLCFVDTELSPDYTAVGVVDEAGLLVLDGIAEAGNDGSLDPSPGGGAPVTPVTIEKAAVQS
ncbi:peptidylprolyl isomerase [Modestobacter sp. I12A-02628]|uniref:Peptidylprolyl isomerase n=1 Tax=Goekera deserti TaxID=2497753 RepID=A0A7K3WAF5_9ACTN|nr:peptidylprolyl isomerase [Goekera deserti]MPQ99178.1 peptidylprolyl isomerase [Goekera deserti]NDI47513.1 peptidylprolyl isomerase [Goekera deserti]NEL53324.1 peptidylprolyl isomerase [Goekera deserti]